MVFYRFVLHILTKCQPLKIAVHCMYRLTPLTPFSYKCPIPTDILNFSIRHIIIVGVLLPKDPRIKRNMLGIELALKLCIQAEWAAAADIVSTLKQSKAICDSRPLVRGIRRPMMIVPCGGTRMQLLTQISQIRFSVYPPSSSSGKQRNVVEGMMIPISSSRKALFQSVYDKRKRDEYLEEWTSTPGNGTTMTSEEIDRHRKIRFVERMSNVITETKDERELFGNMNVDCLNDEEIDSLLGRVLMRFVEVSIERSTNEDELCNELNACEYSGLTLLHHAAFYNFEALATLLLNRGADPDVTSIAGRLTPLHFAASAGHKDIVEMLLRNGCNAFPIDSDNLSPADYAMRGGHEEIAKILDFHVQQSSLARPRPATKTRAVASTGAIDEVLQSAFKELSLKDKLGLNLFVDRSKVTSNARYSIMNDAELSEGEMIIDEDNLEDTFAFISIEDRKKLQMAMSLVNEMDLEELNLRARHQDVSRYLRQSNYEAIKSASKALEKANKKESDILKSVQYTDDPSKLQLSRALAMLVLRKNLPS